MAEDGWLPSFFARRSRYDTPSVGLFLIAVLVLVPALVVPDDAAQFMIRLGCSILQPHAVMSLRLFPLRKLFLSV